MGIPCPTTCPNHSGPILGHCNICGHKLCVDCKDLRDQIHKRKPEFFNLPSKI